MRYLDALQVAALGPVDAIAAIQHALRDGLDPRDDPPRSIVDVRHGQVLLMPSGSPAAVGVKVVSVAPGNPRLNLPRINGVYVLMDAETLVPQAILDGTALTALRTPAVSVAAVHSRVRGRPLRVAVFGAGPQAVGHVEALSAVGEVTSAIHIVRDPARVAIASAVPAAVAPAGSSAARDAVREADVIVCATTARSPLFDTADVRDEAVVIAVGSHEPDARELDAALMARARVVVEDVDTALREAGDVAMAVAEGVLRPDRLLTLRDVVQELVDLPSTEPTVFKSVGMAWEDLVVARAVAAVR